jgi:hypothetical protein
MGVGGGALHLKFAGEFCFAYISVDLQQLRFICMKPHSPNALAEWLRIREVPGSNLGLETGYHDRVFCGFYQSL